MAKNITKSQIRGIELARKAVQTLREMKDGKLSVGVEWSPKAKLREMITTADFAPEFLEKTTFEAALGREEVALVYPVIYSTRSNTGFPRQFTVKRPGHTTVRFLEKLEGEEIKFGSIAPGEEVTVKIKTWAAGFQITEDMKVYNELFQIDDMARAMGEAYNKLLNHLHLSPILEFAYTNTGGNAGTAAVKKQAQIDGTPQLIPFVTDLKTTLGKALQVWPGGNDFKVLVNPSDVVYLQETLESMVITPTGTPTLVKSKFTADRFVEYDGSEVIETIPVGDGTVKARTTTYAGVPEGYIYMVAPKRQFIEYVKHDLIFDADDADLSRLILEQQIARARRGVYCELGGRYGAMKVAIR